MQQVPRTHQGVTGPFFCAHTPGTKLCEAQGRAGDAQQHLLHSFRGTSDRRVDAPDVGRIYP